jgi:hypothetical protein
MSDQTAFTLGLILLAIVCCYIALYNGAGRRK